ncbi:MAG: hypothetical protein P8Y27_07040 [Chromatiaceae bacterium]|jgi:hypothetical protein
MALALMLGEVGHEIERIDAEAAVTIRSVDGELSVRRVKLLSPRPRGAAF